MKRLAVLVTLGLIALLPSCGGAKVASSEIGVDLADGSIQIGNDVWAAGPVDLTLQNGGQFGHTLVVARTDGTVVAATQLIPSGESTRLLIDLKPGRYQISCRIVSVTPDGQIFDHYELGMWANVEVVG